MEFFSTFICILINEFYDISFYKVAAFHSNSNSDTSLNMWKDTAIYNKSILFTRIINIRPKQSLGPRSDRIEKSRSE